MSTRPLTPVLLVSLLAGFAGCSQKPAPEPHQGALAPQADKAPAPPATEPKTSAVVRLGYQKIGVPFLLKDKPDDLKASLAKHGARAEWVEFQAGPPLLEAMRAGAVDIGYVGETPPVFAQAGGVPFVYVASDAPAPAAEAVLVPKGSKIQTPADLKGKKIAVNRGSNVHYLLVKVLESAKLSIGDVTVTYLAPPDARAAFDTGQVDAWVIWDPFYSAAEVAGARRLRDGTGLVDNHLFYVARREFAEKNAALVNVVLGEYKKLSGWAKDHPEDVARILAASSGIAYEALLAAEKRHAYDVKPITPELLSKQQTIADTFYKLQLIPQAIEIDDAFLSAHAFGSGS